MEKLEFQLYDWLEDHDQIDDDSEEDIPGNFIIHSFGRTDEGKSVYAKIINYTPYFYMLIPEKLQYKSKPVLEDMVDKMSKFFKGKENKKVFYKFKPTLKELQLVKLKRAEGFTNDKEFWFVRFVFNNSEGMKKYKSFIENNDIIIPGILELNKPVKYKLYEANLPPMLRCFHIRDISGCSWVETNDYILITEENEKISRCDIEINVDWRKLNPIKKDHNAPFKICSFDIECNSIDGEFPQAKRDGDCVIQIGATYTCIGQSSPYRQYIACLKETSSVENAIVESCETEYELMVAFLNEINNNDCDIMTGYNIFFFDEKYMFDRCKDILGLEIEMAYMSKLKNYKCNFKEMKLASSALGENLLRFWDTPGRIHIDLMKDIQKTFNLPSYKLDYVASKFIRGEVINYKALDNDQFELVCKSVQDIHKGDYIHLEVIKGFVSDEIGEKYLVLDVDSKNKKIIVKGDIILAHELDTAKEGGVINWSQAKDDVGPKDIFRLQKGSPDDRGIVAKYCIKDCRLVNLLINKLEVVTKNIEMANVCYVPLSYLFIRGQGIKLFSLCLKEFRKQKYAFPVLKMDKLYRCLRCSHEYLNVWECPKCKWKKREELESESSSYEGAIVFDPIPKVDYEALATKDYMSLYPASIMHKNMSHETIVEESEYDNLPGIKYYNAQFRESDGSIQYRRFAQIDNKLGVIPTILDNLLKERKSIKKQMAKETDPFKGKILDAKQLAVKITANSLYGQLGATTSPVCKRDIAACTTSTGREMLILAKKYDEEYLPWIMNGLKYFYKNNEINKVDIIYDYELKARNDNELIESIKKYVTEDINNITFQPVIRYGDSVVGGTPLLLKNTETGLIFIESINNLGNNYSPMIDRDNTKESSELNNIETWTEKGWTKIQRVIRHKLSKDKKIFRVTTHIGSVIVTDDHSLLTENGEEISPKKIKIGDKLLHSFPTFNNEIKYKLFNGVELNTEIAQFLGMFMGNSILSDNKDIDHKLLPTDIKMNEFIIKFRKIMYTNDLQKKIPDFILNESREIKEAFLVGLYEGYGLKTDSKQIDCKGMVIAMGIYTLCKSLNYEVFINNHKDKLNVYSIIFCQQIIKDANTITKIEEWLEDEEYVYDLTTDNHHFQAGVGSMIVHNTDSIFSCYRFRENTKLVDKETSLNIWKHIVSFARVLIEPFFSDKERKIFNETFEQYYNEDKIVDLKLPEPPECLPEPHHHAIILPIEERIKQFIKEYMQESYIPWLWTLSELVEKDYTNMFDIKLIHWADHQLAKIKLVSENLYENRRNYLLNPCIDFMNKLFNNAYIMPIDESISNFANKFIKTNNECFPFANELNITYEKMFKLSKNLIEKTIKEKWIYSGERKELIKIINKYLESIIDGEIVNNEKIIYYITNFIGTNKNIGLDKMTELLNKNLLNDQELGVVFNEDKLNEHTKIFIEKYNKNNGKKTMEEILEDFLEKDLLLSLNLYKEQHYNKVINFVNTHMKYLDMSNMDKEQYIYYWIQPRWNFENKKKQYYIDIYEGGNEITDKRTLDYGMEMGKLSGELIKSRLPFPHDCEYEKTFWPFAILTKKRYVGNKYEFDPNKYKQDFMGIVLKRRDNAAIVKEICGGIIDYLINHRSPQGATDYTRNCLEKMFNGEYDIKYFLQSRTLKLKESYKDWKKIAHVYLAEKIAQRDPGNTPQSGDRIEFAVIKVPIPTDGSKLLQGDIIETPQFIKQNNLEIDYLFYLTNQIMNPALQFLELVDKNAVNIFNEFIEKYSNPKPKKIKPVKEPKVKPVKEPKVKPTKEPKVKSKALNLLIQITENNKKQKYILEIKKFIDEINEFMEANKQYEYEEFFLDFEKNNITYSKNKFNNQKPC